TSPSLRKFFRATVVPRGSSAAIGLRRMSFSGRPHFLRESPRITVLLQAMHDIVSNSIAFFLCQFLAKSAHKFSRASQRECDGEAEHVPAGALPRSEQIGNNTSRQRRIRAVVPAKAPQTKVGNR